MATRRTGSGRLNSRAPGNTRRGVLLLVVLSMLFLFAILGITFVIVTGQYRRSSQAETKVEMRVDNSKELLFDAFRQITRDTTNPYSALYGYSLLEDIYGPFQAKSTIQAAPAAQANNQFYDLVVPKGTAMSALPGYYNGCVLTMVSGQAAGFSTRIVGYRYVAGPPSQSFLRIMPFDGTKLLPLAGDAFLINGRPFSGTGIGYNTSSGKLDSTTTGKFDASDMVTNRPYALLLNPPNTTNVSGPPYSKANVLGPPYSVGTPNEDYDAADTQNPLLAYVTLTNSSTVATVIPSLHRPDLVKYWQNYWVNVQKQPLPLPPDLARQIMVRPLKTDHPNFTGSNPISSGIYGFDPVAGPWDVDNDGDGFADSVWVDLGCPVQMTPDGRYYKPLFAILCVDLDGRLNVNAHGSLPQLDPLYTKPVTGPFAGSDPLKMPPLPTNWRGQGYGPAEINAGGLFTLAASPYKQLFQGSAAVMASPWDGRYGEQGVVASPGPGVTDQAPAIPFGTALPGMSNGFAVPPPPQPPRVFGDDPLSALKQFEYPVAGNSNLSAAFGSPDDLQGKGLIGIDYLGIPMTPFMGRSFDPYYKGISSTDTIDDPYELDLSRKAIRAPISRGAGIDNPFTPGELERFLRKYDGDALSLSDRLRLLMEGTSTSTISLRHLMTTDSWDLPCPAILPTRDMRSNGLHYPASVAELLKARLDTFGALNIPAQLQKMLPPELMAGVRMDINRPFGNGRDDNGDGVIDDIAEAAGGENVWFNNNPNIPAKFLNVPFDHANGIATDGSTSDGVTKTTARDQLLARHMMARYLYVLGMLSMDLDLNGPNALYDVKTFKPTVLGEQVTQAVAQWAVNVVDFRDRDSIMTPFEYDVNPFDGWDVDGVVDALPLPATSDDGKAERRLVWGCERPEVLIGETLAWHDRRTQDLATPSGKTTDQAPKVPDPNFDQRLRPIGAAFIELYNPWFTTNDFGAPVPFPPNPAPQIVGDAPGEFYYDLVSKTWQPGVILNKVVHDPTKNLPNGVDYPVWRIQVVKPDATGNLNQDPDDPTPSKRPTVLNIERCIYFTTPPVAPNNITDSGRQTYFSDLSVSPLLPGHYAVVGSSGIKSGNNYVSTVGRTNSQGDAGDISTTRQIMLSPTGNPQVQILNNGTPEPKSTDIQPPIAVVIDQPRSFSISEPIAGYPANDGTGVAFNTGMGSPSDGGVYIQPYDVPFDKDPALITNGTTPDYRNVHLQRLANPNLPWNVTTNPYRTIDSMTVDLTAFNGVEDPSITEPGIAAGTVAFNSHQRGEANDAKGVLDLWRHEPNRAGNITKSAKDTSGTHRFPYAFVHSLGYLNGSLDYPNGSPMFQPYYNQPLLPGPKKAPPAPAPLYVGAPANGPFPWLTWNNRPYVSPMELLLVPRDRSSQLLQEYSLANGASPYKDLAGPYGHLMNLFSSSPGWPQLCHMLEFLQVPSRFVGTETWIRPDNLPATLLNEGAYWSFFHPPFNKVSNYRDPGRVNINTISDPIVWNGIVNGFPGPSWDQIRQSRQGYLDSVALGTYPSLFSNPFRSANGATLTLPGTPPRVKDIDVTLMRSVDPATMSDTPLFDFPPGNSAVYPYNDPARNPYFRYQNYIRFNNLLTTRSNVYAVWITVGYFQVTQWTDGSGKPVVDAVHPDGLQLGSELGIETGEVQRHRAFFIYDRSIPVGYERGQDNNTDKAVLIKRFIE